MAKSIKVHPKKRRGRPATGKAPLVSARLPQDLIDKVEAWAVSNCASRSEAIRRLVEIGLKTGKPGKPEKDSTSSRAQELAADTIETISDPAAHPDQRAERRRRLTKGPSEFREARVDQPKRKS